MNFVKACEIRDIIEEIELNNKDIRRINDAVKDGILGAQITIKCKNGEFRSTVFENDRINLLLKVLYNKNTELMAKLEDL